LSILKQAFKGGIWLFSFRTLQQIISWTTTIIIARILLPEDYGLMEIATVFVGYVALFSELGLGSAIIQRKQITNDELSSTFWFTVFLGLFLAFICFMLSYPTVMIFNEPRILRITQFAATIYLLGGILIVPINILNRELKFKQIGFINFIAGTISCVAMILMALRGYGVWTLIGGHFIRELAKVILVFLILSWKPKFHFNLKEVKPYLKFGLNVAGARSFRYIYTKSDRFFAGRILGAHILGYYSLALRLSRIPTDRIVSLIQQVSFPVFSKYQNDAVKFKNCYLKILKFISVIVFPIFIGSAFLADKIVLTLLGNKWLPMIFPFRILCLAQLVVSITTLNNLANNAQGRPHWSLYFNIMNTVFLPVSFYLACKHSINALAIPWITIFPSVCIAWTWITLKKIGISFFEYFKNLFHPFAASIFMLLSLIVVKGIYENISYISKMPNVLLLCLVLTGAFFYFIYFIIFEKDNLMAVWKLSKT